MRTLASVQALDLQAMIKEQGHRAEGSSVVVDARASTLQRSRVSGPGRKALADADVTAQPVRSTEGGNLAALRE